MKISTMKVFVVALLTLMASHSVSVACNLSDVTPLTITRIGPLPNGPWNIIFRLCVGMGVTGATKGGDQVTSSLYFGFYDSQPGFSVSAFTPAFLISPNVGLGRCSMPGTNFGPDPYFGLDWEVIYQDPGYFGSPASCVQHSYGCVTTTAACGGAQAWCQNCTITVNQIPDSMRVFGVEGGGNPTGGCYPNPDMMINFNSFLPVVWGEIEGIRSTAGVNIKWSTLEEMNTDYFMIERSVNGVDFESIGQVPSQGNSSTLVRYEFFDRAPNPGTNLYRVIQIDQSGDANDSQTIEVNYFEPAGMSWGAVGPNPASTQLNISFFSPLAETASLQLRDVTGRLVMSTMIDAIDGGNNLSLDLSKVDAGNYYLSIQGNNDKLVRKVVKL